MDKQKISIDDLFRQQLSDREESMPPGAWSRMSELLDQQPSRVLAGRNRGKGGILVLLTALLALGAGGYAYQTHQSEATETATPDTNMPLTAAIPAAPVAENTPVSESSTSETVASNALPKGSQTMPAKTPATPAASGKTAVSAARSSVAVASTVAVRNAPTTPARSQPPVALTRPAASAGSTSKPALITPVTITPVPALSETTPAVQPVARESVQIDPLNWVSFSIMSVFQEPVVLAMHPERVVAFLQQTLAPSGKSTSGSQATDLNHWSAKSPKGSASETPVPASVATTSPLSVINPAPKASVASASPVASASTAPAQAVPETTPVAGTPDAALQASRFVGGVLAGINSTLSGGSGALQGIQAGIYGLLKLNETWSLGGELQYLYRLNNSMNFKDDYYTGKVLSEGTLVRNGQTYYPVRYDVDSMLSRYSFTSYSSLSLPLYVQYNRNRLSLYGGLNLGFHFRPNVARVDVKIATISRFDTLAAGMPIVAPASRASDVSLSDFDSRFSVGYLAGAKYQITSQLHLDLRLTQQLWDHLRQRSVGAAKVSETYLYLPTIQLSAGYRFRNPSKAKPKQP